MTQAWPLHFVFRLAVVAAGLVKDLLEHREQCIDIRFGNNVGLLVDVEEDRFGRHRHRLAHRTQEHWLTGQLFFKNIKSPCAIHFPIFHQKGQHLQQVRFTRAKEARNPDPIGGVVIVVSIQEGLEAFTDFISDDVLVELDAQARFIVSLDHAINRAVNGLSENGSQSSGHWVRPRSLEC